MVEAFTRNMIEILTRTTPDGTGVVPLYVRLFCMVALVISISYISKQRNKKTLLMSFSTLSVLIQIMIMSWYIFKTKTFYLEGLPLYHCRMGMLLLPLFILFDKDKEDTKDTISSLMLSDIKTYFFSLSFIGAFLALTFPDIDNFVFPHITQISFFLGHIVLFLMSFAYLNTKGIKRLSLLSNILITYLLHLAISSVNDVVGGNYAFLKALPEFLSIDVGLSNLHVMTLSIILLVYMSNNFLYMWSLVPKRTYKDIKYLKCTKNIENTEKKALTNHKGFGRIKKKKTKGRK